MSALRRCSNRVFRVFQRMESYADRATGAAGPLFVLIALALIGSCVFTFFEIVYPRTFMGKSTSRAIGGALFCVYMVYSFSFHYYMAICVPPGSPQDAVGKEAPVPSLRLALYRLLRLGRHTAPAKSAKVSMQGQGSKNAGRQARREDAKMRVCKKCPSVSGRQPPKPERTHHYCPWINGCVGLHNERYFLLFEVYLCLSCFCVVVWGFSSAYDLFNIYLIWPYRSPRAMMALLYLTCGALGIALFVMAVWQLWLIARGETTVESSDNDYYREVAKLQGKRYINPYDFGVKENLREFFNVGAHRSAWTILLPWPVPPASDGWHWRHRPDAASDIDFDDLTSDEDAAKK